MSTLATLIIKLMGDVKDFEQDFKRAQDKADAFKDKMQDIGGNMTAAGGLLTAGVTLPVLAGFNKMIDAASDMNETMSKSQVVFGDSAKSVQDFAATSATSMGVSSQKALEAAGTYGNLFVSMGMTQQKSAEMSTSLLGLASDLGSFNNMDPTEVLEKLRAGLTGETEPLKSLGVNINAAAVQAKAFSMGLAQTDVDMTKVNGATLKLERAQASAAAALKQHGESSLQYRQATQQVAETQGALEKAMAGSKVELTAAQKAQATYALVMEQTTTAQGDFARTSDGLANSQRITTALFDNAAATLGGNLLPIKLQLVQTVNNLLTAFTNLSLETQRMILIAVGLAAVLGPLLIGLGSVIGAIGTIGAVILPVIAVLGGPVILVIGAVIAIIVALALAWTNNWGGIREKTAAAVGYIQAIITMAFNGVRNFIQAHSAEINQMLGSAWATIQIVVTLIVVPLVNMIKGKLAEAATWIALHGDIIKGFFEGAWNVITGVIQLAANVIMLVVRVFLAAIQGDWKGVWDAIKDFTVGALDALAKIVGGVFQLGANIVLGLVSGLWSKANDVANALNWIVNDAIGSVKRALGIASPSTVAMGWGENTMRGFATGIKRFGGLPSIELKGVATGLNAGASTAGTTSAGGRGAMANVVVNVYGGDRQQVRDGVVDGLRRSGFQVVPA